MKIFLTDQTNNFILHLERLKTYNRIPYIRDRLIHKISTKKIDIYSDSFNVNIKDFLNYNIFPLAILKAYPQWVHENRDMKVNDIIVQQVAIPPFYTFSVKFIMGVRIKEIFNLDTCKGFSYETLNGHLEKGISIFKIAGKEKNFLFSIETYSNPANTFLELFKPISSLYQKYCTEKALKHVKKFYQQQLFF